MEISEMPKLINNINERVVDDLKERLSSHSRISIAAASFSIYAFEALKKELEQVEELRFIFTSPTFIKDKNKKEKREFFIPKLNRERNLYGTDFEIRLRNQLSQKAIAKECAEWIKNKVQFKSNSSHESMGGFLHLKDETEHVYLPFNDFTTTELGCERGDNIYQMLLDAVTIARSRSHITKYYDTRDIGEFPARLAYIKEHPDIEHAPFGMSAVVASDSIARPGVVFILRNRNNAVNIDRKNLLHPFYMVYLTDEGEVICDHLHPKQLLDIMRHACKDKKEHDPALCAALNKATADGRHMEHYSDLLQEAINSIVSIKEESDIDSLFSVGETTALRGEIKGLDDFELITFLIIRN